jgi:hypothetical protein
VRPVAGFLWRQRAQAERRQQPALDRLDHTAGIGLDQNLERQAADREDLVGPHRRIVAAGHVIDVNHVVQAAPPLVPEAQLERGERMAIERAVFGPDRSRNAQRIEPQRLHLDRLADARRDHLVADLSVHPGELHAWHAGGEQPVLIHADAKARAGAVAGDDLADCRL